MSREAEAIETARRAYSDAIGTSREEAAYANLRAVVRAVRASKNPHPVATTCLLPSSTERARV